MLLTVPDGQSSLTTSFSLCRGLQQANKQKQVEEVAKFSSVGFLALYYFDF